MKGHVNVFNWLKRIFRRKRLTESLVNRRPFVSMFSQGAAQLSVSGAATNIITLSSTSSSIADDDREEVKPINIINLLEEGIEFSIENLDKKLDILEEKALLYSETLQRGVPTDLFLAIEMLKARKHYPKVAHLITWKTTTEEKINILLQKYKLDHKSSREFIGVIPEEAVIEIAKFKKIIEKIKSEISLERVELSIIAPPDLFNKPDPKGDPILLAKSPFGNYYYILGAWDKEVDLVGELLT